MHVMKHLWEKPGKPKHKVILWGIAILLLLLNLLVYCDCTLYRTPIAKVISAKNTHAETVSGELGIHESQSVQTLICVVQNGSDKGKTVLIANTYSYTHMDSNTYHKGDFLLLRSVAPGDDGMLSATISGQKRDYLLSFLLSLLLFGAIVIAGERGFSFIIALGLNIGILILGFFCFQTGLSFIWLTLILLLLFSTLSLGLCIGWNRQMLVALAATLSSVGVLAAIYCVVLKTAPKLDYTLLDYIQNGTINLEIMFTCGTLLGSLGAIMDVAISITSGIAEILQKDPKISAKNLSKSVRQIGYDVMGTMINVLFYTYLVGRIPICLAQLANGVQVGVMFKYYLVYEILRFLAGAIGIALCVPISERITKSYYRRKASVV